MAINDKFQLTNYGSEVQKAIDDALITIPQDLALKAYRDEVLVKNQTVPYTPINDYNPATKLYVDTANTETNAKLDEEIARAKAAENVLNMKPVLLYDETISGYKHINLVDLNGATNTLVDETAMDARISELSLGFFVLYRVDDTTGDLIEGKHDTGVNPYIVVHTEAELPTQNIPNNAIGLTLKNEQSINVYKYNLSSTSWVLLKSPTIDNGWLFASTMDEHGYYWFVNTWNLIDMNVDMNNYYTKGEIDGTLINYVQKVTLGNMDDLVTANKLTVVGAINELKNLADTKDTLPTIGAYQVLINGNNTSGKPTMGRSYSFSVSNGSFATRTATGQLKARTAVEDDDLVPLAQINEMVGAITPVYPIPAYSVVANDTASNAIPNSSKVYTSAATPNTIVMRNSATGRAQIAAPADAGDIANKQYVDNYKPVIITQGTANTGVTTSQLTFWVEQ